MGEDSSREKRNFLENFSEHKAGYQPKPKRDIQKGYKPRPNGNAQDSSQWEPPQGGSGIQEPEK